jgi:hypothetical protein
MLGIPRGVAKYSGRCTREMHACLGIRDVHSVRGSLAMQTYFNNLLVSILRN